MEKVLLLYTGYAAAIVWAGRGTIACWEVLLVIHVACGAVLWFLPDRGAPWERPRPELSLPSNLRKVGVFLRYMYPLGLVLLFFEEGRFIVNGLYPDQPYWFETTLYAADRLLFGDLPSILLASWVNRPVTELMHAFYFSYFVILLAGPLCALSVRHGKGAGAEGFAGRAFHSAMGSMTSGFLCAFVWYPWIPARGPFENPALMASLPGFEGGPFTFLARWITDGAAVSGNCFPSAHVAGTWGLVFGVLAYQRRWGFYLGLLAVGISCSCIYTRYHHGVDVPAGFLMGALGASLFRLSQRRSQR